MSAKIVSYRDYVAGWLDTSIHEFLQMMPSADDAKFALITCLDSNPNPASLRHKSPELKRIAKHWTEVGSGLLLPTELLLDMERQIFFGFDEVWFFPGSDIQPKPPSLPMIGPPRLNQTRLRQLGKWMAANSCSLGLGGGDGLNFVVRAHGLVRPLLGHSIEKPESTVVFA